jgi:hypothetical protein
MQSGLRAPDLENLVSAYPSHGSDIGYLGYVLIGRSRHKLSIDN